MKYGHTSAAKIAIKKIDLVSGSLGPSYAAYLALPNVILTLADARGFGDAVFYSPDKSQLKQWQTEIKAVLKVLDTLGCCHVLGNSQNGQGHDYISYHFISKPGLANTLACYSFLDQKARESMLEVNFTSSSSSALKIIRHLPAFQKYDDETIGHILLGIELGYPEQAILDLAEVLELEKQGLEPKMLNAKIWGADFYDCPQPVYSFLPASKNMPDITSHQKLWSQILKDFYTSDFYKNLAKDPLFDDTVKALTKN